MKKIGFAAGNSFCGMGTGTDMFCFFLTLRTFAVSNAAENFVWDRLFRRYLRFEDHAPMRALIVKSRKVLRDTPSSPAVLRSLAWVGEQGSLDTTRSTLLEVFQSYLERLEFYMDLAEAAKKELEIYDPLRTVRGDLLDYLAESRRPLEHYDRLGPEDLPFWMRPSTSKILPYKSM